MALFGSIGKFIVNILPKRIATSYNADDFRTAALSGENKGDEMAIMSIADQVARLQNKHIKFVQYTR